MMTCIFWTYLAVSWTFTCDILRDIIPPSGGYRKHVDLAYSLLCKCQAGEPGQDVPEPISFSSTADMAEPLNTNEFTQNAEAKMVFMFIDIC